MALVEIVDLSKVYRKGGVSIQALDRVRFDVEEGEFVSIVGRSGSGKSTLLNLIGGLDTPTAGKIIFDGRDLAGMKRGELAEHRRSSVGMVFQSFNLIPYRTATENVTLALAFGHVPRQSRRSKAIDILSTLGLSGRLEHKPGEISGGEAQRVAIARALANAPRVLLMDEPTGNLDSTTASEIIDLVRGLNLRRGLSVIMVTHEEDIAQSVSSKVLRLFDGRLIN